MSQHEEQGFTGGHSPWVIALTVSMATFMEVLDTSIANVALPHISGDLSVSLDESTWVLTSYFVSNAIVLPVSGWLANRLGRKRFYMTCVVVFTASSFLCGIAPNLGLLVFFRVLQGIGGGGLAPSEQAILRDTFPFKRLGMAMAIYGMAVVMAPAIGPTLGGYITDHISWRWVFFINVPVGLLSLLLSSRVVVDPPHLAEARKRAGRVDYVGLGLVAVGLGALEYVLDRGQELDWFASPGIVAFAALSALALVTFAIWEWQHPDPVVDVRLFRHRGFGVANLMMLVLGMSLYGSTVLLPQYVQTWMGYSAQQAGMALSPGALVIVALMPLVARLATRLDARWLIAAGFGVLSLALLHMAHTLYPGIDFSTAVWLRIYQAVGLAFLFVPINTVVYAGIPSVKNNAVSGVVNLSRNMGGSIGIALVTTTIARRSQFHQATLAAHLDQGHRPLVASLAGLSQALQHAGSTSVDAARQAYGAIYRVLGQQAQTLAYADALLVLAGVAAVMVPLVFLTARNGASAPAVGH
jgi:DHA2 family multidrug resistance protein